MTLSCTDLFIAGWPGPRVIAHRGGGSPRLLRADGRLERLLLLVPALLHGLVLRHELAHGRRLRHRHHRAARDTIFRAAFRGQSISSKNFEKKLQLWLTVGNHDDRLQVSGRECD